MPNHNFTDLTKRTFAELTVIERVENDQWGASQWKCKCSCGNIITIRGSSLTKDRGNTKSCGCLSAQLAKNRAITHGMSKTPVYSIYIHIINRCNNPNDDRFKDYGGRGITICDEWRHDFMAFYNYVGKRPSKKHSIDRINTNGNYEPGNVRWATPKVQSNNTRTNHKITIKGKTMNVVQWATSANMPISTFLMRIRRGWTPEDALFKPVKHRSK